MMGGRGPKTLQINGPLLLNFTFQRKSTAVLQGLSYQYVFFEFVRPP